MVSAMGGVYNEGYRPSMINSIGIKYRRKSMITLSVDHSFVLDKRHERVVSTARRLKVR